MNNPIDNYFDNSRSLSGDEVRPRIAMLLPSASRIGGGLFTAAAGLSTTLLAAGADVTVLSSQDQATTLDKHIWGEVVVRTHRVFGPRGYCFQPTLHFTLRTLDPQIIHLHGLWTYHSYVAMRASSKRPVVVSPHGMLDAWALAHSNTKKQLVAALYERRALSLASCLHALCEQERVAIRAQGYSGPIAVIPNGIHVPDRMPAISRPDWKSGLPTDSRILLFLGRIHPKKGLSRLLEALSQCASATASRWHVVVAGWDQDGTQEVLRAQARQLDIEHRVHFVGPQFGKEKDACFTAADAFVLPSLSEGLPMSVLEAWSFSLPVLMTSACNLDVGFSKRAAVRLADAASEMAIDLRQFFDLSDQERAEIGANGLTLVRNQFLWSDVAHRMKQTYNWLINGGETPNFIDVSR